MEDAKAIVLNILNKFSRGWVSGTKIYVWTYTRVDGKSVISIKPLIKEASMKGGMLIPIENIGEAFKFPFIVIGDIKYTNTDSAEVTLIIYFFNYESVGFKLNYEIKNDVWILTNYQLFLLT